MKKFILKPFKLITIVTALLVVYLVAIIYLPIQYANKIYNTNARTRHELDDQIQSKFTIGISREETHKTIIDLNPYIILDNNQIFIQKSCSDAYKLCTERANLAEGIYLLDRFLTYGSMYTFTYTIDEKNNLHLKTIDSPDFLKD